MKNRYAVAFRSGVLASFLLMSACGGGGDSPTAVSANPPAANPPTATPTGGSTVVTGTPTTNQPATTTQPPAGGVLIIPPASTPGTAPATTSPGGPQVGAAEAAASAMLPLLMSAELAQFKLIYDAVDGTSITTLKTKACPGGGTLDVGPYDANSQPVARSDRANIDFLKCNYVEDGIGITLDTYGIWGIQAASKTATTESVAMSSIMLELSFEAKRSTDSLLVKSPQTGFSTLVVNANASGNGNIVWAHPSSTADKTDYAITINGVTSTLSVKGLAMAYSGAANGTGSYSVTQGAYTYSSPTVSGSGTFTPRTIGAAAPADAMRFSRLLRVR